MAGWDFSSLFSSNPYGGDFSFSPYQNLFAPEEPAYDFSQSYSNPTRRNRGYDFDYPYPELDSSAMDEYQSYLERMPQRDQYKPGVWNRIAAALAGSSASYFQGPGAGIALGRQMLDQPYREALEDWKVGEAPRRAAMDRSERLYQRDINRYEAARRAWASGEGFEFKDRDLNRREQETESKMLWFQKNREKVDAQIEKLKSDAAVGTTKVYEGGDGKVYWIDPTSKKIEPIMVGDEQLDSRFLTLDQKKKLASFQAGLEAGNIRLRAGETRETNREAERQRQANRINNMGLAGAIGAARDAERPTRQVANEQIELQKLYDAAPASFAELKQAGVIKFDESGNVYIDREAADTLDPALMSIYQRLVTTMRNNARRRR